MADMATPKVSLEQARAFLDERFDCPAHVQPLTGGFWSSAYAFRSGGRELVVRFGRNVSWFEADRAAMAFAGPHLPVPEVLDVGRAFGGAYAVSVRHHGRYLEEVGPEQARNSGPMLISLLTALFEAPKSTELPVVWHDPAARSGLTWRDWLLDGLVDAPDRPVHGWRKALSSNRQLDHLFRRCKDRITELVQECPERRDLVHGDLLHANVLVTPDASRVTAVFSWKCSLRGDFLFDTAWCTFWAAFHPGIAAIDLWDRIRRVPSIQSDPTALTNSSIRHHCYELHIGVTHLGWNLWVGDDVALRGVAESLER